MHRVKRTNKNVARQSPWPLAVMAIGAVFIITVGFLVWRGSSPPPTQATGGTRLNVDRTAIDFGKVPLDKLVTAQFKIKNVGSQPLRILGEPRVELVRGC